MAGRIIVAAGLLWSSACLAQETGNLNRLSTEEALHVLEPVREIHRQQENVGYVFALSDHSATVLRDFAGQAVIEHAVPIQAESRFPVMSITKAFTGLALAHAAANGLVDLDTPISSYLPDYRGDGANAITLRLLAAHLSGIPHAGHPDRRDFYVRNFPDAASSVVAYENLPLAFAPGTAYNYSSSGYNLIATVIEARSGQNYRDYVRQHVIRPLGLQNTDFDDVLSPISGRVRNYSYVDVWAQPWRPADRLQQVPTWDFSYNLGGGNMYSTADDLLRVGNAMLRREGLAPEGWELALSRSEETRSLSPWSLGWIHSRDDSGRTIVSITGATPGVQAALYIYPDEEIVFSALANCWCRNSAGAQMVIGAPQDAVERYLLIGSR